MDKNQMITRGTNAQQAAWQYGGATNIFSTICSLISFSSSRRITPSNRVNNELLVINLAAVTGGRFSNTATSPSRVRCTPLKTDLMFKNTFIISLFLIISFQSTSQTSFSRDPDSTIFLTKDIINFWKAFDDFEKDSSVNPFDKEYIHIGSAGVKGFIPNRIQDAENLLKTVKQRKGDYQKVRENTLRIKEKEKQCRSTFYALKYWYPEAQFPPVYFVIGAYNSGGTFSESGIFVGAEMQTDINNIPYIVAHELIHFQQKNWSENPTLLQQSIVEGSADFLGELISGVNTNKVANDYGNKNENSLCKEFIARMDSVNYTDWMYSVSAKDDRPKDLGYWMGYKITEQYFKKAVDKKQAIKEIFDIKDYKAFLNKSGYLKKYMK